MSKLQDYQSFFSYLQNDKTETFYKGFGQFSELLLDDDIEHWARSSRQYFEIVQKIKRFYKETNRGQEFEKLKTSLLTSFYTPKPICTSIVKSLPFQSTSPIQILEPSAGTGNFIRPLIDHFPNSTITAIEKDPTARKILENQYNQVRVVAGGFEDFQNSGKYDVIISNIPFGDFRVFNEQYKNSSNKVEKRSVQKIHTFFFIHSLNLLKDQGFIVFISPAGFSDSPSNSIFREHLMNHTNLTFFNRLPIETFKDANTKVSSDLIILQKDNQKTRILKYEKQFVLSEKRQKISANSLIVNYGRLGIGRPEIGGQYGDTNIQFSYDGSNRELAAELSDRLGKAMLNVKLQKLDQPLKVLSEPSGEKIDSKKFPPYYSDGNLAIFQNKVILIKQYKDGGSFDIEFITHVRFRQAEQIIRIRDAVKQLISAEVDESQNPEPLRAQLNECYDNFYSFYGPLHSPENSFIIDLDAEAHKLYALEICENKKFVKADIFSKRITGREKELKANNLIDAIAHSLNQFNEINIKWICDQLGKKEINIMDEGFSKGLIYYNPLPNGNFNLVIKEEFVSGDVYFKKQILSDAEKRGFPAFLHKYLDHHLDLIESVQPNKVPIELLYIKLGERWIELEVYERFAQEIFKAKTQIHYLRSQDRYVVKLLEYSGNAINKYSTRSSTGTYYGNQMLEYALIDYQPTISKTIYLEDGTEKKLIDEQKMRQFDLIQNQIKLDFDHFIQSNEEVKNYLENRYHRLFNSQVLRAYDGSHLQFIGLNYYNARPHQKNATWRLIQEEGGIIDHKVGYGKTLVMIMAAMEMKRLGIANKPMITGLKANTKEMYHDFKLAYPTAKVLYPETKDFQPANRKAFFEKIMTNDWDCILMTHDQFLKIPQSQRIQKDLLEEELNNLTQDLVILNQDKNFSKQQLKGLEKRKENLRVKLQEVEDSIERDDRVVDFESMGIDHLFVDESQVFKNLTFTTRHQRVSGLGSPEGSARAFNMLIAVRTLQKRHKGDKGVTFSSGTPISNSLVELYLLFKYLRPKALAKQNISTFDAWSSVYAIRTSEYEFSVTGEIKKKDRYREFVKVPELAKFYREIADVVNEQNVPLNEPQLRNIMVEVEPTGEQMAFNEELIHFAKSKGLNSIRDVNLQEWQRGAYMLIATNLSKKMSLDMRLIDQQEFTIESSLKILTLCQKVQKEHTESNRFKGTQMVFCDLGTPKSNEYSVYQTIKDTLINHFQIPENEIAFIHTYTSDKQRSSLFRQIREGVIRIVLGSTQKLGTGVNVQDRMIAMHHIEFPWRPSDFDQRNGRGARKGNWAVEKYRNNTINNYIYATKKTLDPYQFNILSNKQQFIQQLKMATISTRKIDEGAVGDDGAMNFAEYVALLSGNNHLLEKVRLEKELSSIESSYHAFIMTQNNNKNQLEYLLNELPRYRKTLQYLEEDNELFLELQKRQPEEGEKFTYPLPVKVGQNSFIDPTKLGEKLLTIEKNIKNNLHSTKEPVAHYGPFNLEISKITTWNDQPEIQYWVTRNKLKYTHSNQQFNPDIPNLTGKYIINCLRKLPNLVKDQRQKIKNAEEDIISLKNSLESIFPSFSKINELRERISKLEERLGESQGQETTQQQLKI